MSYTVPIDPAIIQQWIINKPDPAIIEAELLLKKHSGC